jgi:hypothetical protein
MEAPELLVEPLVDAPEDPFADDAGEDVGASAWGDLRDELGEDTAIEAWIVEQLTPIARVSSGRSPGPGSPRSSSDDRRRSPPSSRRPTSSAPASR